MTVNAVSIRPARQEDLAGMLELWRSVFGEGFLGGSLAERTLHWLIEDNPSARSDSWAWVAELGGEIVGAELSTPIRLSINNEMHAAHWLMATAVSRKGLGRGISRSLYRAVKKEPGLTLGVGVTSEALRLYQLEKAAFVGADGFAVRTMASRKLLRRILGHLRRREVDQAKAIAQALLKRAMPHRAAVPVSRPATLPDDVGHLLDRMRQAIPVMVSRTPDEMAWRLANPRLDTEIFEVRTNGELRGLAVTRADGMILDLLATPDDRVAMDALLHAILRWAADEAVPEVSGIMPQMEGFRSAYRRAGFISQGFGFHLFFAPTPDTALNGKLTDPAGWYISMGDSDLWSFLLKT